MISIIIPIYNAAQFLERTFESLLIQTFSDFEVILIDDGSTDNSAQFCKKIAEEDKRFKYFFKENSGVADTRNMGLENATGNYIAFLDSDDTYDQFFLEKLFKEINKRDVAIAVCNITGIKKDNKKIPTDFGLRNKNVIISDTDFCLMQNFLGSASLCNKMFKREVFDQIKFPSGMLFEDNYIFHEIFGKDKYLILIINEYLYNYHYNSNSITRKEFSFPRYQDYVKGLIRRHKFFNNKPSHWLAAEQTKNIILDEMIKYSSLSKEVKRDSLTRKFLIKNLLNADVHYKTKIIVYLKIVFSTVFN